jgi:hypothetical protein
MSRDGRKELKKEDGRGREGKGGNGSWLTSIL